MLLLLMNGKTKDHNPLHMAHTEDVRVWTLEMLVKNKC